jgi:hypothetical protein
MVARELGKYKLGLVGVEEVRWYKGGTERAEDYTVTYSGFSIHDGTLLHSKSQYTTVKHSR